MKLTLLQREILIWMTALTALVCAGIFYINHIPNQHPGMIRLHIIANSDSAEDQALKLKVRNEVIRFMSANGSQSDLESARSSIDANLKNIEQAAEKVISDHGFDYPARACRKVSYIPKKSYEDLTLPAGHYEALKITLGRGEGQNWWCVIFPQLCLIGEDNGSEKIVLKSKVKELMKENPFQKHARIRP